jgi:hypothetical protein
MRILRLLTAFPFLLALGSASAQTDPAKLDAQRQDVVLIRAAHNDQVETATGTFVGKDAESAYFITALHALLIPQTQNLVESVTIRFHSDPTDHSAHVFHDFSLEKDLAVVSLPLDDLPPGLQRIPWGEPKAGMAIHLIGHPPSSSWSVWNGAVENEHDVEGEPEFFSTGSDPSLTKGFSGGPVFSGTGAFLGMHESGSNSASKNLKSSVIVSALEAWHIPLSNLMLDDVDSRRFLIEENVIADFEQDDINSVKDSFAPSLSDQFSNQQLRQVWVGTVGIVGNYQSRLAETKRSVAGSVLYVTKLKFERGNVDLRVSFDSSDHIQGIWLIPVGDHPSADLEKAAASVVTRFAEGNFQSVFDDIAPSLKLGFSADILSNAWNGVVSLKGAFVKQTATQASTEADVVDVGCQFEHGNAVVRVSFAPDMKLVSVFIVPGG